MLGPFIFTFTFTFTLESEEFAASAAGYVIDHDQH